MRLTETDAADAAARCLTLAGGSIRAALAEYGLSLDDVATWAQDGALSTLSAVNMSKGPLFPGPGDQDDFYGRFVGCIGAAIILGVELERAGETTAA